MPNRFIALKYGVAVGVGVCLWIVAEYLLGFHNERFETGKYTGYIAFIFPLIFFWLGLKERRNRVLGGTIRLTQGLKTSLFISIITGLILGAFMFAYIRWINPEFVEISVTTQIEQLRADGLTDEELVTAATGMLVLLSAPAQAAAAFIGTIIQGLLIGFVYTFILSRKKTSGVILPPPAPDVMPEPVAQQPEPMQDIVTDLHIPTETDEPSGEPNENPIPGGPST